MVELILIAAVVFLAAKAGILSGSGSLTSALSPSGSTFAGTTTAAPSSLVGMTTQGATETVAAPCAATVASELTQATGIATPDVSAPFDTLPGAGAVTIGGGAATTGYNPTGGSATDAEIGIASQLAGKAVGMVSAAGAALSGGAAAFSATALGSAIPLIGIGVSILSSVVAMISQHHQQALANEGKVLNAADPNAYSALVLVVQGVINGEITSTAEVEQYLTQIVNDWYNQVTSIQRGKWPYTITASTAEACDPWLLAAVGQNGDQTITPPSDLSSFGTGPNGGTLNWFGAQSPGLPAHVGGEQSPMPSTCNAACTVGHYFVERGALIVSMTCSVILGGGHGIMTLPQLPPHDTQSGVPQVQVLY